MAADTIIVSRGSAGCVLAARSLSDFRRLERELNFSDKPEHGRDGPLPIRRVLETERGS